MPPIPSGSEFNIGRATLICGWTLAAIALDFLLITMWASHVRFGHLRLDEYMQVVATVISLALLIQSTWAVIEEGQGQHIQAETTNQLLMVSKVCLPPSLQAVQLMLSTVTVG